jgi:hypothetical protein
VWLVCVCVSRQRRTRGAQHSRPRLEACHICSDVWGHHSNSKRQTTPVHTPGKKQQLHLNAWLAGHITAAQHSTARLEGKRACAPSLTGCWLVLPLGSVASANVHNAVMWGVVGRKQR